ncbi:MAG: hypothetical protein ABIJ53_07780 [Verrucomicrobiota bacterium]
MCDLGSAAVFSPDGAYTSIAPPATPGRRANLKHSVPQTDDFVCISNTSGKGGVIPSKAGRFSNNSKLALDDKL